MGGSLICEDSNDYVYFMSKQFNFALTEQCTTIDDDVTDGY